MTWLPLPLPWHGLRYLYIWGKMNDKGGLYMLDHTAPGAVIRSLRAVRRKHGSDWWSVTPSFSLLGETVVGAKTCG
jgi:hypothetical protein